MRWLLAILVLMSFADRVHAQMLSAQDRAVLDVYYLKKSNESIPGSYLIDNSVPPVKIVGGALTSNTVFSGQVTGTVANLVIAIPVLLETTVFSGDVSGTWDSLVVNPRFLDTNTTFSGHVTGAYNALQMVTGTNLWKYSAAAPTTPTSAAEPYTMASGVDSGTNYLYMCQTNNWAGAGTNWQRVALGGW